MNPLTSIGPVRVNPLLLHPRELRRPLNDGWRFRLDPDDTGLAAAWFNHPDRITDPIAVPGCWQGQGFGHGGEDEIWDFRLRARVFRATYQGTGWYALTFRAPSATRAGIAPRCHDDRLWLNFGGAHPSADVWLNGQPLGGNDLPFVPFGFEVTGLLQPDADNDLVVRIHEHNRLYGLAYSWQGNWSGLYRGVELTATGAAALHDVRLLPDVDQEVLQVRAQAPDVPPGAVLRLSVAPANGSGTPVTAELPVANGLAAGDISIPGPRLWSPDTPNLYRVEVELTRGDETLDALTERTGFLKLSSEGRRFLINNEPYYLRGSGDFISCPETGCPDTDRERWRRKLQALRDYGYNHVRCQSYVYAPEYFDIADEVGLLIQSEMGMLGAWGSHTQWHVYAWPPPTPDHAPTLKRQWDLVVQRDLNHPSACIYCMSNELNGGTLFPRTAWQCYHDTKALKPQAFVLWTDGGYNPDLPGDFVNWNVPGGQEPPDKPVTEHEFRWWSSFPDVRISPRYDGAVRHYAADLAREVARRRGQEHLLETYAAHSQRLQFIEAKAKMEGCRRDKPYLAGICHFDAMDANPSPQGIITEFYEDKLIDAETWRQTNGDTVILSSLNFDDRVLTAQTGLRCALHISDFSHPPFDHPRLTWRLTSAERELGAGELTWAHEPFTTCPAGEASCALPEVDHPERLRLQATLTDGHRTAANEWDLWLFPSQATLPPGVTTTGGSHTWIAKWNDLPTAAPGDLPPEAVVLTERLDDALLAHLQQGGRVIMAVGEGYVRPHNPNFGMIHYFFTPPANYGPYEDGQNGTVIADHPLLGDFPHEGFADWPFFRMIEHSPPLDLEPLGLHDEDPVIRVIHRYPVLHPLGYLVERSYAQGRLVMCALELDPAWPEARYLLSGMCRHLQRGDLPPAAELSAASLARLRTPLL